MSHRTLDHITNAVDQTHFHFHAAAHIDRDRLLWNEFRLGRRDRFSSRTLRKLIHCTHTFIFIRYHRQHQFIHEMLNESRFAGSYGADNADIKLPVCPAVHIIINIIGIRAGSTRSILHIKTSCKYWFMYMQKVFRLCLFAHGTGCPTVVKFLFILPALTSALHRARPGCRSRQKSARTSCSPRQCC